MTNLEFVRACQVLRWTPSAVAIDCGYTRRMASWWSIGKRAIPPQVSIWLKQRLSRQLVDPPPRCLLH